MPPPFPPKNAFAAPRMASEKVHTRQANHLPPPRNAFAGNSQSTLPVDPSWFRQDGSQKGRGYLGPLTNRWGETMTEYSIGVGMDGREVEIPTLVPGLTAQELHFLLNTDGSQPIPQSIVNKAVEHARMRMQRGLSPWHDSGPNHTRGQR